MRYQIVQLGKTGFIQLHLSPELYWQLWVSFWASPFLTLLPAVKNGHLVAIGQNYSIQRVQLFKMLIYWKCDLLDFVWLSCIHVLSCSRGLIHRLHRYLIWYKFSSYRPLGFSCSKLFKNLFALGCHLNLI